MKKMIVVMTVMVSQLFCSRAFAVWTSLAPDFSGVQADTLTTVSSILGILVIVAGLGILLRVMLR